MYLLEISQRSTSEPPWDDILRAAPDAAAPWTFRVNRDVEDARRVTVIAEFSSIDAARAFVASRDMQDALHDRADAEPQVVIYEETVLRAPDESSTLRRYAVGTHVEVRDRYQRDWSEGYEVVDIAPEGYRLRRRADGRIMPSIFPFDAVRRHRP